MNQGKKEKIRSALFVSRLMPNSRMNGWKGLRTDNGNNSGRMLSLCRIRALRERYSIS